MLLDKPTGITSNHALQRARRLFARAKAGHTGTLDPLASGLLPICFGEATKFSQSLLDSEKTYEALVHLGWRSSTGDAEGELSAVATPDVSDSRLRATLEKFTGVISQVPPMFSALKSAGQPLYKLARQGLTVERAPRKVIIHALDVMGRDGDRVALRVTCSKGTYIRVLSEGIGDDLGCGAYLEQLRRTAVADFQLNESTTLEALEALSLVQRINLLEPVDALVASLPELRLHKLDAGKIKMGQPAHLETASAEVRAVRLYGPDGDFIGLGEVREDGMVHPKRLLSHAGAQSVSP